jgi:hypothetical protein
MHFASQAHRQTVPRGEMGLSSFLIAATGWSSTPAMRALGSQAERIASMRGAEDEDAIAMLIFSGGLLYVAGGICSNSGSSFSQRPLSARRPDFSPPFYDGSLSGGGPAIRGSNYEA